MGRLVWGACGGVSVPDVKPWLTSTAAFLAHAASPAIGKAPLMAAGAEFHSAALMEDGTVRTWGDPRVDNSALGLPLPDNDGTGGTAARIPALVGGPVDAGGGVVAVAASMENTYFLREDGVLVSAGQGFDGALGVGGDQNVGRGRPPSVHGIVTLPTGVRAVQVATGTRFALVLGDNYRVWSFGLNDDGQQGIGDTFFTGVDPPRLPPFQPPVPAGGDVVSISAGHRHSAFVLGSGAVVMCGANADGQLGAATTAATLCGTMETTGAAARGAVCAQDAVVAVAGGADHTLFLLRTGAVLAAGSGAFGQTGLGTTTAVGKTAATSPCRAGHVPLGARAVTIAAGSGFSVAVMEGGEAMTWGRGSSGRLSRPQVTNVGDTVASLPFVMGPATVGAPVTMAAAGFDFLLLVTEDGELRASGGNSFGQLGLGDTVQRFNAGTNNAVVQLVPGVLPATSVLRLACGVPATWRADGGSISRSGLPGPVVHVSASEDLTLAVMDSGSVFITGPEEEVGPALAGVAEMVGGGSAGRSQSANSSLAVVDVQVSGQSVNRRMAWLLADGTVRVTGSPSPPLDTTAAMSLGGATAVSVSVGASAVAVVTSSGRMLSLGSEALGCRTSGLTSVFTASELPASTAGRVRSVKCGDVYCAVLDRDGNVDVCSSSGEDITTKAGGSRIVRVDLPGGARAVAVSGGESFIVVLTSEGEVFGWGRNHNRQLGSSESSSGTSSDLANTKGVIIRANLPRPAVAVDSGAAHTAVLLDDGTVLVFGAGASGQLGRGSTADLAMPLDMEARALVGVLPLGERAVGIAAGSRHTLVVLESGQLAGFGANGLGQVSPWLPRGNVLAAVSSAPSTHMTAHRPAACASVAASVNLTAGRPLLHPGTLAVAPGAGAAPWRIDLTGVADTPVWPKGELRQGVDVYGPALGDSTLSGPAAVATRVTGVPSALKSADICPTGLTGVAPVLDLDACLTPPGFDWGVLLPLGPSALGGLRVAGNAPLLLPAGSERDRELVIEGGLGWAALLESVRDDAADRGGRSIVGASAVATAVDASATVWLEGGGEPGVPAWRRRAKDCRFSAVTSLLCRSLPAGSGAPGSVRVSLELGSSALAGTFPVSSPSLGFARPRLVAVSPSTELPTRGNRTLIVQGSEFGEGDAAVPVVTVAPFGLCAGVRRVSDKELTCRSPPGAGDASVSVSVAGQSALASLPVSFSSPVVALVSPTSLLAGASGVDVVVNGTNLAVVDAHIDSITVGGLPCPSARVIVPGRSLLCSGIVAPATGFPRPDAVSVSVRGRSSGLVAGLFVGIPGPRVDVVSVAQIASGSGSTRWATRLSGAALGRSNDEVLSVTADGVPVAAFAVDSRGTGASVDVQMEASTVKAGSRFVVTNKWGVASAPSLDGLTLNRPTITSVSPSRMLVGAVNQVVNISGAALAVEQAHLGPAFVGGVRCGALRVVNPGRLLACEGFDAPTSGSWPAARQLNVTILGQAASAGGLFEGVGAPVVQGVSVAQLSPLMPRRWVAEMSGVSLGISNGDISVTAGGQAAVVTYPAGAGGSAVSLLLPLGVSAGDELLVRNGNGILSTSPARPVALQQPSIESVHPDYALAGQRNLTITVTGSGLALREADVDTLNVGGMACRSVTVVSPGTVLECRDFSSPAAWSSPRVVWVAVAGRRSIDTTGVFEGVPRPSITATAAASLPTSGDVSMRIVGTGFGRGAADVAGVCFRDADAVPAPTSPACLGLFPGDPAAAVQQPSRRQLASLPDVLVPVTFIDSLTLSVNVPPGAGRVAAVVVMKSGERSPASVQAYNPPVIESVTPSAALPGRVIPSLTVCGENFPPAVAQGKLESIVVGGLTCGAALVHPTRAGCALCRDLDARGGFAPSLAGTVRMTVAGTATPNVLGLFDGKPRPFAQSAEPAAARQGDSVTVVGVGLGLSAADIANMTFHSSPASGGTATCSNVDWRSDVIVACAIPTDLRIWQLPDAQLGTDPTITIRICTTAGLCTPLAGTGAAVVRAAGVVAGPAPVVGPWGVTAVRDSSRPFEVTVQWAYVHPLDEAAASTAVSPAVLGPDPAASFVVSFLSARALAPVDATGSGLAGRAESAWAAAPAGTTESREAARRAEVTQTAVTQADETSLDGLGAPHPHLLSVRWELHRSTFTVAWPEPLFVRVAPRTAFQRVGAVSSPAGPVADDCSEAEFLTSNLPLQQWTCSPCLDQAVCEGLPAANVTARPGWWRVPWSPTGLGFAQCDPQSACVGVNQGASVPRLVNASSEIDGGTEDEVTRTALVAAAGAFGSSQAPLRELLPDSMEGCGTGRTGVLCQACGVGFHVDVGGGCSECGEGNSGALATFAGVGIAALFVVALLVTRAVRSAEAQAALASNLSREELESPAEALRKGSNPLSRMRRASTLAASLSKPDSPRSARGSTSSAGAAGRRAMPSSVLSKRSLATAAAGMAMSKSTIRSANKRIRSKPASRGDTGEAQPQSPKAPSPRSSLHGGGGRKSVGGASPRSRRPSRMARLSVVFTGGTTRRRKNKKKAKLKLMKAGLGAMVLKLVFNHVQLLSIISGVRLAWPPAVQSIFDAGDVASGFSTAGLGLECLVGDSVASAIGRAAGVVVSSPALMLWAAAVLAMQICVCRKARKARAAVADSDDSDEEPQLLDGASPGGGIDPPMTCRSLCALWAERVVVAAIFIGFVTHASVTRAAFGLLACRRLFPQGQEDAVHWVLTLDPDIDCEDPTTTANRLSVAIPALVLMTLGLPALALTALVCPRTPKCCREKGGCATATKQLCSTAKTMLGCGALATEEETAAAAARAEDEGLEATAHLFEASTIRRWGFLFQGFRRRNGAQVWEVVNMARKTLIAGATVLLASSGTLEQAMAALCVAVVFLVMHSSMQPYESATLNRLETVALTAACITLASVPILVSSPWDPQAPPLAALIATALIVAANGAVAVGAFGVVVVDAVRRSVKKARKNVQSAALSHRNLDVMQAALSSGSGTVTETDDAHEESDEDDGGASAPMGVESPLALLQPPTKPQQAAVALRRLEASASAGTSAVLRGRGAVRDTFALLETGPESARAQGWSVAAMIIGEDAPAFGSVTSSGHASPKSVVRTALGVDTVVPRVLQGAEVVACPAKAMGALKRLCGMSRSATLPSDDVAVVFRRKAQPPGAVRAAVDARGHGGAVVLALDGVADPGNVGALCRSAAFFGASGVLLGAGTADPTGCKALAASRGAALGLACERPADLGTELRAWAARGATVLLAEAAGGDRSALQGQVPPVTVLVLGSEGQGLSKAVADALEGQASVARVGIRGARASWATSAPGACLNVASAGAVLLARLAERDERE